MKNNGAVKLETVTPDAEKVILRIARVSSDQTNESTGLINYLIKNGHWSPFEHASMTLEINTSRAISQQIVRHRSFTFQEFSQRYAKLDFGPDIDGAIVYPARIKQGESNRQGSIETMDIALAVWWKELQKATMRATFYAYEQALEKGIAPELARMVLPLSSRTKLYMTGTLRSWIHYLGDGPGGRTNPHTQQEHRELALMGKEIFCENFPIIAKALEWTT